jgi:hypothetical protein
VSENRELKREFGTRRGEVVGGFETLHNEKLHNFYTLPNIIKDTKAGG